MFDAAIASAQPARCLPAALPSPPRGRTVVVGAGKAAAAMARVVEQAWPAPLSGVVVTRYGHAVACERIEVLEAGHPVPDQSSVAAAARLSAAVTGLSADDLVLFLGSGGGSALLAGLPPRVTLADEQALSRALLRSGATIAEINCVRRQVSLVRGGRLAEMAAPARVMTLLISDVPGDDPALIASGPTVASGDRPEDALAVLSRYGIEVAPAIIEWLEFARPVEASVASEVQIVASAAMALEAAADVARAAGVTPIVLGEQQGEARVLAAAHVKQALATSEAQRPCVLISGGETTVTVLGDGRGGRNTEYLLALGLAFGEAPDVWAIAGDTDGIDGSEQNAGALWRPDTSKRLAELSLDPASYLAGNDSYTLFEAFGDLVVTGPTHTNVNDFRAILLLPASS